MANTFSNPPDWLDPSTLAPGAPYDTTRHAALAASLNYAHAQGNCQPVFAMGWPSGACSWDSTVVDVLTIAVPPLSDAHTYVYCRIWALRTTSNATITFTSANSAATRSFTVSTGTSARYGGSLNLGVLGASGDVITVSLTAGAAGTVQLDDCCVEYIALTSPLAAGAVGGFTPLGATRAGADYPVSTARGRTMLASARDLVARPRCLFNWSGLQNITSYNAEAQPFMPGYVHMAAVQTFRGAENAARTVIVRALCESYLAAESTARIIVGSPASEQLAQGGTITVPLNDPLDTSWYEVEITLPEARKIPGSDYDGTWIGIHPAHTDTTAPPGGYDRTSAKVLAVVAWGY